MDFRCTGGTESPFCLTNWATIHALLAQKRPPVSAASVKNWQREAPMYGGWISLYFTAFRAYARAKVAPSLVMQLGCGVPRADTTLPRVASAKMGRPLPMFRSHDFCLDQLYFCPQIKFFMGAGVPLMLHGSGRSPHGSGRSPHASWERAFPSCLMGAGASLMGAGRGIQKT